MGEFLPDETNAHPASAMIAEEERAELRRRLNGLPKKYRDMLWMRCGLTTGTPMKLEQVARKFGVTRQRVDQVEKMFLKQLRGGKDWLKPDMRRIKRRPIFKKDVIANREVLAA